LLAFIIHNWDVPLQAGLYHGSGSYCPPCDGRGLCSMTVQYGRICGWHSNRFFPGTLAFSCQYHSTSDPESFIRISLRLHNGSNCQCCSITHKRLHVLKLTLVSFHVNISYHNIFMIIIFKLLLEPKIMAFFQ